MKRYLTCFMAIVLLLSSASVFAEESLKNGIYVFRNKSYYAFNKSEEIRIGLLVAYVNKSMDPNQIHEYGDLELQTDKGEYHPIAFTETAMALFTQDREQSAEVFYADCVVLGVHDSNSNDSITFTSLAYTSSDGKRYTQNIGTIEIEIIDSDQTDITANSMELNYFSISIPVFDTVRYLFENNNDRQRVIKSVMYGSANVNVEMGQDVVLDPNESIDVEFDVALDDEPADEVFVYAMKPKYYYDDDGQEKVAAFCNVSYWAYIIDFDMDIERYLEDHLVK